MVAFLVPWWTFPCGNPKGAQLSPGRNGSLPRVPFSAPLPGPHPTFVEWQPQLRGAGTLSGLSFCSSKPRVSLGHWGSRPRFLVSSCGTLTFPQARPHTVSKPRDVFTTLL